MTDKIIQIAEHFGEETQKKKLHEEVCELIVSDALGDNEEFLSESADVIILIMQRAYQRGISEEEIEDMVECKLNRTLDRIERGYYE
jgi:phosphoribosyl-ATP pyrophosphohydrolase